MTRRSVELLRTDQLPPGPELDERQWLEVERTQPTSLQRLAMRYGSVFTVFGAGRSPRVYVADPDLVRELFLRHGEDLEGQGTNLFRPLVGEGSLTFLNGSRHQEARRVLARSLAPEDLRHRAHAMAGVVAAELSGIPPDAGIPLQVFTNDVTRKIIVGLTFGGLVADTFDTLLDAFDRAVASLHRKQAAILASAEDEAHEALQRFGEARADLDAILRELLCRHRASARVENTIIGSLAATSVSGRSLSDEEIICFLITIMVSGQETTSASLAWALQHLARKPEITVRLRDELHSTAADPADFQDLPYLQAICMETLRHSSPVPNGSAQKVVNEISAGGYVFPPGVEIVPSICVSHVDNFAKGGDFDPERFLDRRYRNNEYMPFSVGSRYCPGSALAIQELAVAIGVVVGTPDVRVTVPGDSVEGVSLGPTVRVPGMVMIERGPS
ncbi:cytochrome P450 [Actinophytocola sediminis]